MHEHKKMRRKYYPDARSLQEKSNVNQNDFLLDEADLAWLRATFKEELTSFEKGGHLGNLSNDAVQEAILNALTPIR